MKASALLLLSAVLALSQPSPDVAVYLDEALQVMRQHALTSSRVNWDRLRREVHARARGATSTHAAYPALRYALRALGDGHSFLQLSDELQRAEAAAREGAPAPETPNPRKAPSPFGSRMRAEHELLREGPAPVAYVFMPQGRRTSAFAEEFQKSMAALESERPCGWIVDLRGNGGGDMWPMLAGLGPLLGAGQVGGSVHASGARDRWHYERGTAIFEDTDGTRKTFASVAAPVTIRLTRIAVLIDRGTASSGEAMAIAFRRDPRARSFGERTYGASTATRGFKLRDGANLVIAVSVFTDRRGTSYPDGVAPDVAVRTPDALPARDTDAAITAALRWLRREPGC